MPEPIFILYNGAPLFAVDGKPIVFRDKVRADTYCADMAKGLGVDPSAFTTTTIAPAHTA